MVFLDKYGYPVEKVTGRPVINIIRLLLYTNVKKTISRVIQDRKASNEQN